MARPKAIPSCRAIQLSILAELRGLRNDLAVESNTRKGSSQQTRGSEQINRAAALLQSLPLFAEEIRRKHGQPPVDLG